MQLTAAQQQDYIQAMGIEPWYPRVRLANAPLPLAAEVPEADVEAQALPEAPLQQATAPMAAVTLNNAASHPVAPQQQASAAPEPVKAKADEQAIRFGLGLYVYGDWLIASSLTSDYQNQQDAAASLIANILNVLSEHSPKLAYHHVISWPFFSNPNASQGVSAASQYVGGVIEHLAEEHQAKKLVVFGGVLPKLQKWTEVEGEDFGMQRIILPSVYKMLAEPMQKRKAWDVLKASALMR